MKNTFAKLRKQLRFTEHTLNATKRDYQLVVEENEKLQVSIDAAHKRVEHYRNSLIAENKAKNRLKTRLATTSQLKNDIYKNYIKEIETKNKTIFKYKIICLGLVFIVNAVAAVSYVMIKG